jgi:hypothetical protein
MTWVVFMARRGESEGMGVDLTSMAAEKRKAIKYCSLEAQQVSKQNR